MNQPRDISPEPNHQSTSGTAPHTAPLVSIGMPVFNEARFIKEALNTLIAQSYTNIEILVSDNASTDDTYLICEQYRNEHPRIRIQRFESNQGAAANFRHTLAQSTGKYFMWAAGHDRWSHDYIEKCVETLEMNPSASLAFASTLWIDDKGNPYPKSTGWTDTRGLDIISRFFVVFWGNMNPVLGLIRRSYLKENDFKDIIGADLVLLTQLALKGDFIHAEGATWNRREFRSETSYAQKVKRYTSKEYQLTKSILDKIAPLAKLPIALAQAVFRSDHPTPIKIVIAFALLTSLPAKYFSGKYLANHGKASS